MPEPIPEEQFRQLTYEKHKDHFDHVIALLRLAQDALRQYRYFTSTHYQASLQLIFGRAFNCYDSIRRLCELARCEDAGVLLRSLLNLLAVTRWISSNPQQRAKRYFDWYWVSLKRDSEKFADTMPPSWFPTIQRNFDLVRSQFEYKDKKKQRKLAEQWYQPDARSIRDLFEQVDMKKQYDEAYGPLSSIEHSDINAFFAMIPRAGNAAGEKRLEIQNDLFVPHYLRNGFQYFADIFRICNKTVALTDGNKLEEIIQAGMQFYADDMRRRGMSPY